LTQALPESTQALPADDHDAILAPLYHARDARERASAIAAVAAHAADVVDRILARRRVRSGLLAEDVDDARASVLLRIMQRLQAVGAPSEADTIRSFDDFVAKAALHAIDDLLRVRYPARTRLKNRIRYAIKSDARFSLRIIGPTVTCSLNIWPSAGPARIVLDRANASAAMTDESQPADAVYAVLAAYGRPMPLDELVEVLSDLWGVARAAAPVERLQLVDDAPLPGADLEARQSLRLLWDEIRALPERQRTALLLHLRDDDRISAVPLLVASGIADFGEIARAAGVSERRLEELWDELPLDDNAIALILSTTRQAVINLRKTARERLVRSRRRGRF
jgi:hypothetical protein